MKILSLLIVGLLVLTACTSQSFEIKDTDYSNLKASGYAEQGYRVVEVRGSNQEFFPREIIVNEGDMVKIRFTSNSQKRGFKLEHYDVDLVAEENEPYVEGEFIADKKGEFEYGCQIYCGLDHHRMRGKLIVR